jgi:hypothetical protein
MLKPVCIKLGVIRPCRFEDHPIGAYWLFGLRRQAPQGVLRLELVTVHKRHTDLILKNLQITDFTTFPPNLILDCFLNEPDSLEHVGDIVDAALLHIQLGRCFVEIDGEVVLGVTN